MPVTVQDIIYNVTVQQGPSNEVIVVTPGPQGATGPAGNGFIQTGPFTVAGGANQNLSGELTASATYNMVEYTAKIIRSTTAFVRQSFIITFRNSAWQMIDGGERYDDASAESQVVFTVDPTSGQINASNTGSGNVTIYLQKDRWTT